MATKKEELSRWRNLTKGRISSLHSNINNLLMNLPNDVKSLHDDERALLLQARSTLHDLLATWNYRSKELVSQVNVNL